MIANFCDAGFACERGIPGATACRIEAVGFTRFGVGETRIDEFCMWYTVHEFVWTYGAEAAMLRDQPAACGTFQFCEQVQFFCIVSQGRQHGRAHPRPLTRVGWCAGMPRASAEDRQRCQRPPRSASRDPRNSSMRGMPPSTMASTGDLRSKIGPRLGRRGQRSAMELANSK